MEIPSVTLISALYSKYSHTDTSVGDGNSDCLIFIASTAPGKTESGSFRVPENLTLNSFNITSAGCKDDISRMCADVIELDLTENKISSWSEVLTILDCLPKLDFLNLTKNPLMDFDNIGEHTYPNLRKIALNFTNLSWQCIQSVLKVLPNLEELYLGGNCYEDVTLEMSPYPTLHLLQLTSNKLSDWTSVVKLDRLFPNLQNLILAYNNIVNCASSAESSSLFSNLRRLNMNNTDIADWNELDNLSTLKSLEDIRLASIPLFEGLDEPKRRQLLSVYFPHVKRLNGSPMTVNERETAERVYIRHFMDNHIKPNRYFVLEARHGKLDPLVSVDLAPKKTISVTVICEDKEEVLDIPSKWTVVQLIRSLKSFTGTSKFRVFHDHNDGSCSLPLQKNSSRSVYSLNFTDGDRLICYLDSPTLSPANQP